MLDFEVQLHSPCGRLACEPGWSRTRENSLSLRDAELWYVWRGSGWMRTRTQEFSLWPGFCAIMRPGGIYDAGHTKTEPLGIVYAHFDARPKGRKTPSQLYAEWPEFFELSDIAYWEAMTRRIVELAARNRIAAAALLKGALADLLQCPSLDETSKPASALELRVSRAIAQLSSESAPLPTVAELAREAGASPAHFGRVFHRLAGHSPKDFLLRARLARAQHCLRETAMRVSEIAEHLGYADVFFFSRQFKQKTGISPLAYRRHGNSV